MNKSKQYEIPKRAVIDAYQRVKANKGSAGIDGIDFEKFEEKLNNNLYKIWNRMSSGSYFPSPVMAVEIPKKSGGTRRLGIPTITDRVAQMVARMYVEKAVEPMFCEDSYGYRPNKSALDAIEMTRKRCWKYDYVIELDVKGLFDNIDHEWMIKFLEHDIADKNFIRYIKRFLIGGVMEDGKRLETDSGTVQGGLISPVLANVYLHYTLDTWFDYVKKYEFKGEMYMVRYADDCAPRRRGLVA